MEGRLRARLHSTLPLFSLLLLFVALDSCVSFLPASTFRSTPSCHRFPKFSTFTHPQPWKLVLQATGDEEDSNSIIFISSEIPPKAVEELWKSQRKPLLRLGSNGVKPSHRNSLSELLKSHAVVKVKVNDPAADMIKMARELVEGGEEGVGHLLQVKGREFLVASQGTFDEQTTPK